MDRLPAKRSANHDIPVLDRRALNRALLERQKLLARSTMSTAAMVEHLVGQQAQVPLQPYFGLWSRIENFQPGELARMVREREAVRSPLMRTTVHLVTARDALRIYPLVRSVFQKSLKNTPFGKGTVGVDIDGLLAYGRELLEGQPRTMAELGPLLQTRWPDRDPKNLAYAVHYLLPLVQVPPRGVWGERGQATWTTTEHWVGQPLDAEPSVDDLVLRYLAAFGPATTSDVRTWSGLTGLREVVNRLRPQLMTFRDESNRELFDIPDAPRPDPDMPAPPRFLPGFDNVLLSHADRDRIVCDEHRRQLATPNGVSPNTFLVDGFVAGTWTIDRQRDEATLILSPMVDISRRDRRELEEEGARLLAFAEPDAGRREIRFGAMD